LKEELKNMKKTCILPLLIGLPALAVMAACGGSAAPAENTTAAGGAPVEAPAQQVTEPAMPEPTDPAPTAPAAGNSLAWFDIELRDVNTDQAFKLSDFKGQIVLVEGMAVWCTNCLRQQRELVRLHKQVGEEVLSVAIDVDLNEDEALLKRHAEVNGFDWRYAIATPELAQALADAFGNSFLNPTSVPMFLVDKQGGVHLLDFGHKTVEYLTEQIQAYQ
jgi:thiol-disulfide isomerase/thioredoxin